MSHVIRISKDFSILFLGNVASQGIIFASMVYLGNVLSPAEFGRISFAQSFILFFMHLSTLGLDTVGTRELASQRMPEEWLVSRVIGTRALLTIAALIAFEFSVAVFNLSQEYRAVCRIFVLYIVSYFFLLEWLYQGKQEMMFVSISRVVRAIVFVVPVFLLTKVYGGELVVGVSYVVSGFVASLVLVVFYLHRKTGGSFSLADFRLSGSLLKESLPIGIATTLMQIPFNYGAFAIGLYRSDAEVGTYSAAYRVVLVLWSFGVIAAYNSFFPTLSTLFAESYERFSSFTIKLSKVFVVIGVLIGFFGAILGKPVLHLLYAGRFDNALFVFTLAFINVGLIIARAPMEYSFLAARRQQRYLSGMVFVATLYVISAWLLVPRYGYNGAIVAASISESLYTLFVFFNAKILGKSGLMPLYGKFIIAVSATFIFMRLIGDARPIVQSIIAAISLVAWFVLLQVVKLGEIRTLTKTMMARSNDKSGRQ